MSTLRNKPTDYATTIALQTYATENEFKNALTSKREFVRNLSYIVHDKDNADPHIHAVMTLSQSMQLKRVCGWFKICKDSNGEIANTFAEEMLSAEAMEDYLTHSGSGQEGKHQYDEHEIKVLEGIQDARGNLKGKLDLARESKERKEQHQQETEEQNETFLNDLIARKPHREMAKKYGRDYMKNYKNYRQFAWEVELEEGTKSIEDYLQSCDCVVDEKIKAKISAEGTRGYAIGVAEMYNSVCDELEKRIQAGDYNARTYLNIVETLKKGYF